MRDRRLQAAEGVLDTARWLADKLQARLAVVHVVGDREDVAGGLVARVRGRLGDADAEVQLAVGSPADAIRKRRTARTRSCSSFIHARSPT